MVATIVKSTLLGLTLGVVLAFAASPVVPADRGSTKGLPLSPSAVTALPPPTLEPAN
jgi:hypothetical protein